MSSGTGSEPRAVRQHACGYLIIIAAMVCVFAPASPLTGCSLARSVALDSRGATAMAHRRVADFWSKLAKQQGYPARSVFKLKEIDFKHRIFHAGDRVLDLGCSPGSWSMFAAERVGSKGFVLGLDLQPLPLTVPLPPHVTIMRQDVMHWNIHPSFHNSFDVLLSDMAPSTSGIKLLDANASIELCERALSIAHQVLKPNGTLVMKIFVGGGFQPLLKSVQSSFLSTRTLKPESTRGESVETFIIAQRRKFPNKMEAQRPADASENSQQQTPPAGTPTTGTSTR